MNHALRQLFISRCSACHAAIHKFDAFCLLSLVRRAMARAELGGLSVEGALSSVDKGGRDSLSHAEFWEVSFGQRLN